MSTKDGNNPWEEYPHIWKTKSAFMSYIRGGIRRGLWNRHPVKLEFKNEQRFKAPLGNKTKRNPEGMVWACRCSLCGSAKRETECEVDHKEGNHSLKSIDDLLSFITNIVLVKKEDLQIVCKDCHKIKSYAERHGISFEDAKIEKQAIEFCKKKVGEQKALLLEVDAEADVSSQKSRRGEFKRLKKEGKI